MTIVEINACNFGSTGGIMLDIGSAARKKGYSCDTFCAAGRSMKKGLEHNHFIGTILGHRIHSFFGNVFGFHGLLSVLDTSVFCRRMDRLSPDLIHLHNLHNDYINIPKLIRWIKKRNIPVVWTLHDCWAFTGRCPYFDMMGCSKWKTGCYHCPYPKHEYPASYIDRTKFLWKHKKQWFTGLENLTVVTPSKWLAGLVKQSFLSEYPVQLIPNGIDLSVFRPTDGSFRERYHIPEDKPILLGVSFDWGKRKGLDVMLELAEHIGAQYQIVLVGTNESLDQQLPKTVISIHRTESQKELAEIYSAADVFVNPTREDNYPTVNMESISCGTPVVTFDTGGSPEALGGRCGIVVPKDDVNAMLQAIQCILREPEPYRKACLEQAKTFDKDDRYTDYLNLYSAVCQKQGK